MTWTREQYKVSGVRTVTFLIIASIILGLLSVVMLILEDGRGIGYAGFFFVNAGLLISVRDILKKL
jgi:hypothetical protein